MNGYKSVDRFESVELGAVEVRTLNVKPRALIVAIGLCAVGCLPAEWGASAILHPWKRPVVLKPDIPFSEVAFRNDGLTLRGWLFRNSQPSRGLVVYLHGIADNRQSGTGMARWLLARGYDVLACDARAHGQSEGTVATYGAHERRDVAAALDVVGAERAILFGVSYGASVALQAAAEEPRVMGVVAIAPFADLRSVVEERAPWFATRKDVAAALALAGDRGRFDVEDASAVAAARRLRVPVLLLHGARDRETRPVHSRRIHDALPGARRLVIVPGAGHNDVLGHDLAWREVESWLAALPDRADARSIR